MEGVICVLCSKRKGKLAWIPGKHRQDHADWHARGCRTREEFAELEAEAQEAQVRDAAGYGAVGTVRVIDREIF